MVLKDIVKKCQDILVKIDVPLDKQFLGNLNAVHPGGMLPLNEKEKDTLHNPSLPQNLYIADATILPHSMGNQQIPMITALVKRIAKIIKEKSIIYKSHLKHKMSKYLFFSDF